VGGGGSRWGGGEQQGGALEQGRVPAPQKHHPSLPRPNPGPPPFAGPQASSAVGPRAVHQVEVLG
jgi:hypothetical protein